MVIAWVPGGTPSCESGTTAAGWVTAAMFVPRRDPGDGAGGGGSFGLEADKKVLKTAR